MLPLELQVLSLSMGPKEIGEYPCRYFVNLRFLIYIYLNKRCLAR